MFKHYFEGVKGIEIYPVFLLVVFISFFVCVSVWLILAGKKEMEQLSRIPFDNQNDTTPDA